MSGFLSALGGFAKSLDTTLQTNTAYAQQARAAKEAREADFLNAVALKRMDYRNAAKIEGQANTLTVPGFNYLLNDPKQFEKDNALYSRNLIKQVDARMNVLPKEQQIAIFNNPDFSVWFADTVQGAMAWKDQKGENGRILGRYRWSPDRLTSPTVRSNFAALGHTPYPKAVSIDPITGQLDVTINALTGDRNSIEYGKGRDLVNGKHGEGTWERWVEVHKANDLGEVMLPLDTRIYKAAPGTSGLNAPGTTLNRALTSNMDDTDKLMVSQNENLLKYFNPKSYLSQVLTQYLSANTGTKEKKQLAKYMMEIANDGETGNADPGQRTFSYYRDHLMTLAQAISYATGTMTVVRDGEMVYENKIPGKQLDPTHFRQLQESSSLAIALNDQFDDIQKILLTIEAGGLPGASVPLSLSTTLTTIFGDPGDSGGEGIDGIVSGLFKIVTGVREDRDNIFSVNRQNGYNADSPEGRFAFSDDTLKDLARQQELVKSKASDTEIQAQLQQYQRLLTAEGPGSQQNVLKYFTSLKPRQQDKIRQFYLAAAKTELTYKLAMAWQGGAGGRMVSDQDFKVIKNAIWGLPSGKAQAAALELVRMSTIRPMMRSQILLEFNTPGRNPFKILDKVEPALQAAYDNAYEVYLRELGKANISEQQLEDSYQKAIGSDGVVPSWPIAGQDTGDVPAPVVKAFVEQ